MMNTRSDFLTPLAGLGLCFALALSMQPTALARDYSPKECPVVANTQSGIYHIPGGYFYARMLVENKGRDNRKCFQTEGQAQKAGYRPSRR